MEAIDWLSVIRDFGVPVALVVFGCAFLWFKAWPEYIASRQMFGDALTAFTMVLEKVLDKFGPSE